MKKLFVISALALFSSCSKQVNFEKLLPQAFNSPAEFITDISAGVRLSDYYPNLENIDSVTCVNANIMQDTLDKDIFRFEPQNRHPFYVLDVWKKQARTSLIVIDPAMKSENKMLFITSNIDNRERIQVTSNEPVDEWLVLWQNVEVPLSCVDRSDKSIVLPVPENARWIDNSELRILAFSKGSISNQSSVYLSHDQVSHDLSALKSGFSLTHHTPKMKSKIVNADHQQQIQLLQESRPEWLSGDEYSLLDDGELLVYVRTYMGSSSFFVYNKSDHDIKKHISVPDNVKMGNLKTYFDQSIKQTGENIVINISAGSYEIATSEML